MKPEIKDRLQHFARDLFGERIWDFVPGSSIESLPEAVAAIASAANRMCRFTIQTASSSPVTVATGFLVGEDRVMTAGHLLYDENGHQYREPADLKVSFDSLVAGTTAASLRGTASVQAVVPPEWDVSSRAKIDVVCLQLDRTMAEERVNGMPRGVFTLPSKQSEAPLLRVGSMIHVLQYVDEGPLRISIGRVEGISPDRTRIEYCASTLDRASGAAILDSSLRLAAIHVSGPERPFQGNLGIPISMLVPLPRRPPRGSAEA